MTKARLRRLEMRVYGGVAVETFMDPSAEKSRVEQVLEAGRIVLRIILSKDDAGLL